MLATVDTTVLGIYKYRVLPFPGNPRAIHCLSRCHKHASATGLYKESAYLDEPRTTHFITPQVLILLGISYKV